MPWHPITLTGLVVISIACGAEVGGEAVLRRGPRAPDGGTPAADTNEMRMIVGGSYDYQDVLAFHLDALEVSAGAYSACVDAGVCPSRSTMFWGDHERGDEFGDCNFPARPDHPMNCVSQLDAIRYCDWREIGGRLPSAREFFWASRGRDDARRIPWGKEEPRPGILNACGRECHDEMVRRGWEPEMGPMYEEQDGWIITAPVGMHESGMSRDGVHDLAGNVAEWTSTVRDGLVTAAGGSWGSSLPHELRTDLPSFGRRDARNSLNGFRCARDAE
jgi:sulfatase modifying factor 1